MEVRGLRPPVQPPMSRPCRFPGAAPVAQLDRAPDYESGGQRFESFRARHFPRFIRALADPDLRPSKVWVADSSFTNNSAGQSRDCNCQSIERDLQPLLMRGALVIAAMLLSACASAGGPYPSLQPRAAEKIDPRVPIEKPKNNRPAASALKARLASLIAEARNGDAAFTVAAADAERLAASAGAPQTESWIAAQEALTAAVAARKSTAMALGDIDEIGATALQTHGGIAPNDLAAIDAAAREVAELDQRQADQIKAIQVRLGL